MKYIKDLQIPIRQVATAVGALLGLLLGILIASKAEEFDSLEEVETEE